MQVTNGPFLDWGIEVGFVLGWQAGQPHIYDGGDIPFSATSLASVGQGVVGILEHPDETKNRDVYIEDIKITQNKLLELAKKAAPEKKWEPVSASLDELIKTSDEKLAAGDYSVILNYILRALYDPSYGSAFEKVDNELLGIKGKTDADVEAIWKKVLAQRVYYNSDQLQSNESP